MPGTVYPGGPLIAAFSTLRSEYHPVMSVMLTVCVTGEGGTLEMHEDLNTVICHFTFNGQPHAAIGMYMQAAWQEAMRTLVRMKQ